MSRPGAGAPPPRLPRHLAPGDGLQALAVLVHARDVGGARNVAACVSIYISWVKSIRRQTQLFQIIKM